MLHRNDCIEETQIVNAAVGHLAKQGLEGQLLVVNFQAPGVQSNTVLGRELYRCVIVNWWTRKSSIGAGGKESMLI